MLTWEARYNDGSYLPQYNEDGKENKYVDIDRDILEKFILRTKDNDVKFVLNIDPGKKLIFRRRIAKNIANAVTDTVYIIGWQQNVEDKAIQSINFYFESTNHVETTDGFKEDHHWYYPVIFLPEEEI